ncbi:MAG: hypothetical protein ABMA13_22215 [Chthoniobacteraceae bacterium]
MKATFTLNKDTVAAYKKAFREMAAVMGKNDPESLQKLALLSGRRVVKNIVDITPPAKGKADASARKRGEQAILNDILRIAIPVTATSAKKAGQTIADGEQLAETYRRSLVRGGGSSGHRVNPRSRKHRLLVRRDEFMAFAKLIHGYVGWLCAGLNAAASKLGFKLPQWITRHGQKYGKIEIKSSPSGIRIRFLQDVPFADAVAGYARKWNWALQKEVKALLNQAKAVVRKRARKTGLKLK